MADFITLTCPSCGSKLQLTNDIEHFSCASCGNEHIVRRSGGIVSLAPVVDQIQKVQVGVDKTASELAIKRLSTEIEDLQKQKQAITVSNQGRIYAGIIGGSALGFVASLLVGKLLPFESGLCLGLSVLVISMAIGTIWGIGKQRDENAAKYLPIDREIQIRQREIQRHKDIVSS